MNPYDRVRETTTSTGTGDLVLAGAADASHFTFSSVLSDGQTLTYVCLLGTTEMEVGWGKYNSGANSITRLRVFTSTNSNALVNFSAGTKKIWIDRPAFLDRAMYGLILAQQQGLGVMV